METLAARGDLGSVGVSVGDGSVIRIVVMRTGRTGCPNMFKVKFLQIANYEKKFGKLC